jgi:hypothetical protein
LDVSWNDIDEAKPKEKKSWIDTVLDGIFWPDEWDKVVEDKKSNNEKSNNTEASKQEEAKEEKKLSARDKEANELRDQIKKILEIPDSEYKDSMLT